MLQFLFLSFGIVFGIEISIFFIYSFSTNFFSYGNSLGIHWVIYGFGSLLGLPLGLALQTTYKSVKNQFTECSLEVFISRLFGFLIGLGVAHLFCEPFYYLLTSKELFIIKPFIATLANIIFGYLGALSAGLHSRFLLEFLIPKFVESLLIYQSIAKPATVRILDTNCLPKHNLIKIFETKFLEGALIISETILIYYKNLTESLNYRERYYGEKALSTINQLKQFYPNQILLDFQELVIPNQTSFKFIPIISDLPNQNSQKLSTKTSDNSKLNLISLIKELRTPYIYRNILSLQIQKKGTRFGQGIGYLEDGTMVIVERGYPYIGQQINVIVKKIRQRSSGRILFTYPQITLLTARNRKRKEKKRLIVEQKKSNK